MTAPAQFIPLRWEAGIWFGSEECDGDAMVTARWYSRDWATGTLWERLAER